MLEHFFNMLHIPISLVIFNMGRIYICIKSVTKIWVSLFSFELGNPEKSNYIFSMENFKQVDKGLSNFFLDITYRT